MNKSLLILLIFLASCSAFTSNFNNTLVSATKLQQNIDDKCSNSYKSAQSYADVIAIDSICIPVRNQYLSIRNRLIDLQFSKSDTELYLIQSDIVSTNSKLQELK